MNLFDIIDNIHVLHDKCFVMQEVRLSGNPVADLGKSGIPRFVFVARLKKIKIFNGSEVSLR